MSRILFVEKNPFSLPWSPSYDRVETGSAREVFEKGKLAAREGYDSDRYLPVRNEQDWLEASSFYDGSAHPDLADQKLAEDLLHLKERGASFVERRGSKKTEEVGPYGAYNFLTNDLDVKSIEIEFDRASTINISNRKDFEGLVAKAKMFDQMTADTEENWQQSHWIRLYEASVTNPKAQTAEEIARHAADDLVDNPDRALPWDKEEAGYLPQIFEDAGASPLRVALAQALCNSYSNVGGRTTSDSDAVTVYDLASKKELGNREFLLRSLSLESVRANESLVGHPALPQFFPKEFETTNQLLSAGLPEGRDDFQFEILRTQLEHPQLTEKIQTVLKNPLSPEAEQIRQEAQALLEVDGGAPSAVVDYLKLSALRGKSGEAHSAVALDALASSKVNGELRISSKELRRHLIDTASRTDLPSEDFAKELQRPLEQTSQRNVVRRALFKHLFPEKLKLAQELMGYSQLQDNEGLFSALSDTLLALPEIPKMDKLAELASSKLDEDTSDNVEIELQRITAKKSAESHSRSKFLVQTADALSTGFDKLSKPAKLAMYSAANKVSLSDREVFDAVRSGARGRDLHKLQRLLASEFYPDLVERVDQLAWQTKPEHQQAVWSHLFDTVLDSPKLKTPGEIARNAASGSKNGEIANAIRFVGLKAKSLEDPRAKQAIELVQAPLGERRLWRDSTVESLYSAALKTQVSESRYLLEVLDGAAPPDRAYLLKHLAGEDLRESLRMIPSEEIRRFEEGEMNLEEFKELLRVVRPEVVAPELGTEVSVEEDLLLVGNETLEVDL